MKNKPEKIELSAAEQLDALELICRSLAETLKRRQPDYADDGIAGFSEQLDTIDFSSLRNRLCLPYGEADTSDTSARLEELRSLLDENEQKTNEFKSSLADSVVENRNLQRQHQALQDRFNSLNTQLTQMQLHSKDVSLKYSTASTNLEARERELETASTELQELRARTYQLKSLCAEYEDQLKKLEQELTVTRSADAKLKQENEKAVKDLDHIASSNRELRQTLEALQQREIELIKAIDALQREKNHIQAQLSRMLTGLNKMAPYQAPDSSSSESSLLEPRTLVPYLPFCFPEKLPAVIKFRREIQARQPVSLQRQSLPAPRTFTQFGGFEASVMTAHLRMQTAKIRLPLAKPLEMRFHAPYHLQPKLPMQEQMLNCYRIEDDFASEYERPESFNVLQKKSSRIVKLLVNRNLRKSEIITDSFELLVNYLASEIITRNFNSDDKFSLVIKDMQVAYKATAIKNLTNIFVETLAFRHRFQLQSQRMKMADASFSYSFKRSNRLKSALEMFSNTISSMVQKYDIVATPQNGKSDHEK